MKNAMITVGLASALIAELPQIFALIGNLAQGADCRATLEAEGRIAAALRRDVLEGAQLLASMVPEASPEDRSKLISAIISKVAVLA